MKVIQVYRTTRFVAYWSTETIPCGLAPITDWHITMEPIGRYTTLLIHLLQIIISEPLQWTV